MGNCLCFDWSQPKNDKMHREQPKQVECPNSRPFLDSRIPISQKSKKLPDGTPVVSEKRRLQKPSVKTQGQKTKKTFRVKGSKHMIFIKMVLSAEKIKPESMHLASKVKRKQGDDDVNDEFDYVFFKAVKLTRRGEIIQSMTENFADIIDFKSEYPIEMVQVFDPHRFTKGPKFQEITTKPFYEVLPNGSIWTVQIFKRSPENSKYVMHFSGCKKMLSW